MGGGCNERAPTALQHPDRSHRHPCPPSPSFLRRQEPRRPPNAPNSSLPHSRGEVRWGVEATSGRQPPSNTRSLPPSSLHLSPTPRSPRPSFLASPIIPALSPSFLRRQEPRACDGCAHHRRRPVLQRNGWWRVGGLWMPPGSCLRRNDGEGAGVYGSMDALWRSGGGRGTRSLVDARCLSPPT